jgi:hypothetical protein
MTALTVALLTAGCAGSADNASSGSSGSSAGSEPAQPPADTGDRLPALSVECSGGLAGVQGRLDVQPDGTATASQQRTSGAPATRLSVGEQENLVRAMQQAAARTYRPTYRTEGAADLFTYRIRFGTVAVTADEMAVPAELAGVIDALAPVRTRLHLPC